MARDRNTFGKRMRENKKRQKAEEKRARRQKKKGLATAGEEAPVQNETASEP